MDFLLFGLALLTLTHLRGSNSTAVTPWSHSCIAALSL